MVRTRIVAALLALPLTACEPSGDAQPTAGARKHDALSSIQSALAAMPGAEIAGRHDDGVPFLVRGHLGSADASLATPGPAGAHRAISASLRSIAGTFRLDAADLVPGKVSVDAQGFTHLRYTQTKNGLPVRGQELVVHLAPSGNIVMANGSARDGETGAPSRARIAPEAAVATALRNTVGPRAVSEGAPQLVYLRPSEGEKLALAYEVVVTGEGRELPILDHAFVDAVSGVEVARHSRIHTALSRRVHSANNGTSLPGTLRRSEGGAPTGDAHIDMNYDQLGFLYDCYKTLFDRDSYNNAGALLISSVHYSTNFVGAFWNGSQMVYGDGDGTNSGQLGRDADVTVHELTHAVTASESGLIFSGQPGGLNEAMSDTFAAICESWSRGWAMDADVWKFGEDTWTPSIPGDAIRYMDDPARDGISLDWAPNVTSSTDVHYSSGVPNLAFKLLSTGGTHPRGRSAINVPGVGIEVAGRIWYMANTSLYTPSTTLDQAKAYTAQAAQLLGYSAAIQDSVNKAWDAVGVGVTLPPPACTLLNNGETVTGLSGTSGSQQYFCIDVPAGRASSYVLSGGTGDADMYVRIGAAPTATTYNCRPYLNGNNETCNLAAQSASSRIYVMLRGYTAFSGTSLRASY